MFYRPKDGHGLPHNPFNAIVTPRPIGWISTRSPEGQDNLAPYSFFNGIAYTPPQVMFSSTSAKADRPIGKDSLDNIRQSREFCVNIVGYEQRNLMNQTSGPYDKDVDEFDLAGIEKAGCHDIACARVAASPASLECRLVKIVDLLGESNHMVIGEVVGVHIDESVLSDGIFDVLKYQPLTRLGYQDYSRITEVFSLKRPGI